MNRLLGFAIANGLALAATCCAAAEPPSDAANKGKPAYRTESLRGRVVWMAEAMKERYGVETDSDARHSVAAFATDDGQLLPIVKDFRGRGFYIDPRLHEMDLELLVRRFAGAPAIQVVRVYALHDDGKYELDYWCDVCSIPMYELKECECCQGPIRIRERLVEKRDRARSDSSKDKN
jgi:hypothetical protein